MRGAHRLHPPRLGGRQGDRPHAGQHARPPRQREPDARSAHHRQGRRGERARLPRPRLCRLRPPAARCLWQPHSAILLRGGAAGRGARQRHPGGQPHPGGERVRLHARPCHAGARLRRLALGEPPPADEQRGCRRLARHADGAVSQPRARRARRQLVRRRPARRLLHHCAARRDGGQGDRGRARPAPVAGLVPHARDGAPRQPGERAAGLWRHAVGRQRDRAHPAPEGARPRGRALSVHHDGRAGRQRPARSLDGRRRATGLSLARAPHLPPGPGPAGIAGRRRRRRGTGSGLLRPCPAAAFHPFGRRHLLPGAAAVVPAPADPALCPSRGGGGRRPRLRHRLGAREPDAPARRLGPLSGDIRADRTGRSGARGRRPGHGHHLCGRLDGIRRPCARRRQGGALPARSALGLARHRRGGHRFLPAAERLARRHRPCRCGRGACHL